jgi:hypothetical protein
VHAADVEPLPRPAAAARRPDYAGGSIVNLMASIIQASGGAARYPPLIGLAAERLSSARSIVLIVVDGLGYEFLRSACAGAVMRRHILRSVTSVFPPTTAAAVTSFLTGLAPQQHGVTGWFTYFEEIGEVVAVLPFTARVGGEPLTSRGIRAGPLLGHVPVFDEVRRRPVCIVPRRIADSEFNRTHIGRARMRGYATLSQFISAIEQSVTGTAGPSFVYAYWPQLDHLAHEKGIASEAVHEHLAELDAAYEDLLQRLKGSETVVLLTADHGFVDIPSANVVDLAAHAPLVDMLRLPLCGEPRTAYCYVAPGREREFRRYVAAELGDTAVCIDSAALIEDGYFGPGAPHPRLHERIGRYTLLMRDGYAIRDRVPGEGRFEPVGMHGGGSSAELLVPLLTAEA